MMLKCSHILFLSLSPSNRLARQCVFCSFSPILFIFFFFLLPSSLIDPIYPISTKPTEKYDRQLRLWGRNGQKALVESRVLLLGASCTGSETLKNIVLPGCGSITIVDDAIVNEGDVASNFFTRSSDIGRPRAEAVKEWMCEMNPDTQSSKHIVQSPSDYISSRNGDFTSFTLIIATQLPATILRELGKACAASGVPLLVVRTYGLIGYVRVVLPRKDHPIVQDHKMNDTSDQWIQNPWPALNDWRNSFHLDQQTKVDHIHTPWPVILHHLLAKFKAEHGEEAFSQLTRAQLGDYVLDYSLQHRTKLYEAEMISKQEDAPEPEKPAGGGSSPLNYLEAKSRCYKALSPAEIPYGLKKVLDDPRAASPVVAGGGGGGGGAAAAGTNPVAAEGYTTFWILMQAINRFKEKEGRGYLPVTGTVVDMTASSVTYIAMQTQHQEQHARDVVCVTKHAHDILQECGQSVSSLITTPFADDIETMVSIVIKNIREVSIKRNNTFFCVLSFFFCGLASLQRETYLSSSSSSLASSSSSSSSSSSHRSALRKQQPLRRSTQTRVVMVMVIHNHQQR